MSRKVGFVENVYVFGNAEVSCSMGTTSLIKDPFIAIAKLDIPAKKISEDILDKDIPESEKIILLFKNIESLEVLEHMIKQVRKEFKRQDKLKP